MLFRRCITASYLQALHGVPTALHHRHSHAFSRGSMRFKSRVPGFFINRPDIASSKISPHTKHSIISNMNRTCVQKKPIAFTIKEMGDILFATHVDPNAIAFRMMRLLVDELSVRIAHIHSHCIRIRQFIDGEAIDAIDEVAHLYIITYRDLTIFRESYKEAMNTTKTKVDPSLKKLFIQEFIQLGQKILDRHSMVVLTIAHGMKHLRHHKEIRHPELVKFLNKLYLSRIGTRTQLNLFIQNFNSVVTDSSLYEQANVISSNLKKDMNIIDIINLAVQEARLLCMNIYIDAPNVTIIVPQTSSERNHQSYSDDHSSRIVTCTYIPSHIFHIMFELIKNSMRAVIEHCEAYDIDELPNIKIIVIKEKDLSDITIKIHDKGGGIPRSEYDKLFTYMYSTAKSPLDNPYTNMNDAPLAGFGYGLPLSRLYARYLGGEIRLISMEGYGTDAYVSLKANADERQECIVVADHKT